MKAARDWLSIYAASFVLLFAALLVTLFTHPPYGSMTRIGQVSEDAFGWRVTPPPIPMALVRNVPLAEADVAVIGDSFSMYLAWQSVLAKAGYRVATTHWDKVGPLCDDLGPWLRRAGFKGRLVVLESVEWLLPERLAEARQCHAMRQPFLYMPAPPESPSQPPPPFTLNWKSKLFSGLTTYWRTREIHDSHAPLIVDAADTGMIFSAPLPDGCAQFSNRLCDKGLFLMADRTNPELTADDAEFMHRLAARQAPLEVRWMVIPNKTTVYLDAQHAHGFVQRADALGLGPDLFALAQAVRHRMIDLYWPNDPHWSMQGQLYFGEQMLVLARSLAGAPSPNDGRS